MIAGMGAQIYGGMQQASAEREAGRAAEDAGNRENAYYKYLAGTSRLNIGLVEAQAKSDSEQVGAQQMDEVRAINERGRETVGAQKAALVSGAGVGSKTAEQIVSDTVSKTNLDEMALRYNADVKIKNIRIGAKGEAFNLENQAQGYEMAGRNAEVAGQNARRAANLRATGTLINTAAQTAFNAYTLAKDWKGSAPVDTETAADRSAAKAKQRAENEAARKSTLASRGRKI
jgi:hypothetical protein